MNIFKKKQKNPIPPTLNYIEIQKLQGDSEIEKKINEIIEHVNYNHSLADAPRCMDCGKFSNFQSVNFHKGLYRCSDCFFKKDEKLLSKLLKKLDDKLMKD